jgi:hypothetical protein
VCRSHKWEGVGGGEGDEEAIRAFLSHLCPNVPMSQWRETKETWKFSLALPPFVLEREAKELRKHKRDRRYDWTMQKSSGGFTKRTVTQHFAKDISGSKTVELP